MSVRVIEIKVCDRCGEESASERAWETSARIGFMFLTRGSGSWMRNPNAAERHGDLDHDLCDTCTEKFRVWWTTV